MHVLDIMKQIVRSNQLEKVYLQFITHRVGINWRQKYNTAERKLAELDASLIQDEPMKMWFRSGSEFLENTEVVLRFNELKANEVVSLCSILHPMNKEHMHIPMMNFHPGDGVEVDDIIRLIKKICSGRSGFLLFSGRYWHYWGDFLLTEREWICFNCQFLMPTLFISERYIGHSLYRGYNSLRLSCSPPIKPKTPELICKV